MWRAPIVVKALSVQKFVKRIYTEWPKTTEMALAMQYPGATRAPLLLAVLHVVYIPLLAQSSA